MVDQVQVDLEALYRIRCSARAERFVIDPRLARELGLGGADREQLLVREEEDGLDLGLYFAPGLLERLAARAPHEVAAEDLDGFCQVAEGVSHFVYLAQAAEQERRVSLLELEAQAEVDKFLLCLLHRWGDGALQWARELLRRLFEAMTYLPQPTPELRHRYEEASRLARNYCERLMRFVAARDLERLLTEARYGYRLGAEAKLRYLAAPA